MISNDERREVATKLRWIDAKVDPGNSPLMLDRIRRAIGAHMDAPSAFPSYEWLVTYAHVTLSRLADLIEPEERTCRCGVKTIGHVYPDVLDLDGEYTTIYIFPLSCGHEVRSLTNSIPRFCPNCGAKVDA